MRMSMHVVAVKPADLEYMAKASAYRACELAGVKIPESLIEFFNGEPPDDTGTVQPLSGYRKSVHESCEPWSDTGKDGFQVDVTKLPPGTKYLRFYCAY